MNPVLTFLQSALQKSWRFLFLPAFSLAFVLFTPVLLPNQLHAQRATLKGKVVNTENEPVELAIIRIKTTQVGSVSASDGSFQFNLPADTLLTIEVRHQQYATQEFPVLLAPGQVRTLLITVSEAAKMLKDVEVTGINTERDRDEAGLVRIDPARLKEIPTPFMDFSQALITGGALGIVGNNELSSSYAVRGGNFDENLVYVDNIQVYRPFLGRSGEQEGLSFINPEMVESVEFSSGGWQAKYGDKLSSVLNVRYKTPKAFAASFMASMLGGHLHTEGSTANQRFSYTAGFRHKSAGYLLNTLETNGQYLPRFSDFQGFFRWKLNKDPQKNQTTLSVLTNYARNRYFFRPETRETEFGTFQEALRLRVAFAGAERMEYDTFQGGLKLAHRTGRLLTEAILSGMRTFEREYLDVEGGYLLCQLDKNPNSSRFNQCAVLRGVGTNFLYARNRLNATIFSAESRNELRWGKSVTEMGLRADREQIADQLYEYSFLDSARFVTIQDFLSAAHSLSSWRLSGYAQHTWFADSTHVFTVGGRFNYWSVNGQMLFSPRLRYAWRPRWQKDIVFTLSAGMFQQPPFYRELRDFRGNLNMALRAQSSVHFIAGMDYGFTSWGRPFRFISELYHKQLWNVVPYDVDNIRMRYYANNDARAEVTGLDLRLSGEFIPGTESWFSVGLMQAREDVEGDERGWIRRPSDQRLTVAMFFEDHLPHDPSFRMHIRLLYGSGLPYGPPNRPELRQAFRLNTSYFRSDVGFSKIIRFENEAGFMPKRLSVRSMWIGLEVLNLLGVSNNISFSWIEAFGGQQFAVPNSLSQRFLNLRMLLRM